MFKFQRAYDKSIDWVLGVLFQLWVWQTKALGIEFSLPPEIQEALRAVMADNDELLAVNEGLLSMVSHLESKPRVVGGYAKGDNRPNRKKLTPAEVINVRALKRSGWSQKEIADAYDVNPATISRIVRNLYYPKGSVA